MVIVQANSKINIVLIFSFVCRIIALNVNLGKLIEPVINKLTEKWGFGKKKNNEETNSKTAGSFMPGKPEVK